MEKITACTAKQISNNASKAEMGLLNGVFLAIDTKIRLACAHKLSSIDFSLGHCFFSEAAEAKNVTRIGKNLRKRGFDVKYNFIQQVLRISWVMPKKNIRM